MAAIGYTSGDPRKVSVTGDTMTGDLVLSGATTDLTVEGTTTIRSGTGFQINAGEALTTSISTGVFSGGIMSINAGNPSLVDISPMVGYVHDSESNPAAPTFVRVDLPQQTGLALDVAGTQIITWWMVTSAGTIVQQNLRPTPEQRRANVVLGITAQVAGIIVFVRSAYGQIDHQPGPQLVDLMLSLGPFLISGGIVGPNGANLMLDISEGELFVASSAAAAHPRNPHRAPLFAQSPIGFLYATRTAISPIPQTSLDVGNYNPTGDTVSAVGGGANTSTLHRVYAIPAASATTQLFIQYPQTRFSTLAAAVAAIGTGTYDVNPVLEYGSLICYIAVTRTANNLTQSGDATFIPAPRFTRY